MVSTWLRVKVCLQGINAKKADGNLGPKYIYLKVVTAKKMYHLSITYSCFKRWLWGGRQLHQENTKQCVTKEVNLIWIMWMDGGGVRCAAAVVWEVRVWLCLCISTGIHCSCHKPKCCHSPQRMNKPKTFWHNLSGLQGASVWCTDDSKWSVYSAIRQCLQGCSGVLTSRGVTEAGCAACDW